MSGRKTVNKLQHKVHKMKIEQTIELARQMLTGRLTNKELMSLTEAERNAVVKLANKFRQLKPKPLPKEIASPTRSLLRILLDNRTITRKRAIQLGLTDAPAKQTQHEENKENWGKTEANKVENQRKQLAKQAQTAEYSNARKAIAWEKH